MIKHIILTLTFFICLASFSQNDKPIITNHQKQVQQNLVYNPNPYSDLGNLKQNENNTISNNAKLDGTEEIGLTNYDQQSFGSDDNRFCTFSNGTMAVVYTFGPDGGQPGFEGLGTGYNYFNGSSWGEWATERIESERSGWPTIAPYGVTGEIVISHLEGTSYGSGGLVINTRPVSGTGNWTENNFEGPEGLPAKFPRIVTNGENNNILHLLYSFMNEGYSGMTNPILYNRSMDGGNTWDIAHQILDGMTADDYQSMGDIMVWAEPQEETIAFAFAHTWTTDLVVMKSENNGDDWDKIVVWEHPYPFFDWQTTIMTDTMWAPDGGVSIDLDNYGNIHLAASLCRVFHNKPGYNYTSWPYAEGIIYWNESRPVFENSNQHNALNAWNPEILEPDVELIGWGQDSDGDGDFNLFNDSLYSYPNTIGASTMPGIACGENGKLCITWSGICEICAYNEMCNYRHAWSRTGINYGEIWTDHYCLFSHIVTTTYEYTWPVLNKTLDDGYHVFYQLDYDPGTAVKGDHDYYNNRFEYYWGDLPINPGVKEELNEQLIVSQNYPNPATGSTTIHVEAPYKYKELTLKITSTTGQVIYREKRNSVNHSQNAFVIDVSEFSPGIYFYTVTVDGKSTSRKMVVR